MRFDAAGDEGAGLSNIGRIANLFNGGSMLGGAGGALGGESGMVATGGAGVNGETAISQEGSDVVIAFDATGGSVTLAGVELGSLTPTDFKST